jgi:hypothetical protein
LSILESEFIALSSSFRSLIPVKRLIEETLSGLDIKTQVRYSTESRTVFEDNAGALQRSVNLYKSCILLVKINSPLNLIRDKGIYSTWVGSILTSAGPSWDLRVQLMEHEGEDQWVQGGDAGALQLVTTKQLTPRTRHAATKYFWFLKHVDEGLATIVNVESSQNKSDAFPKSLKP